MTQIEMTRQAGDRLNTPHLLDDGGVRLGF